METQQKYDRKATRSGVVYVATNLLVSSSNLLLIPIYTSMLSKEEYGLFAFFVSLVSLMIPLISLAGDSVIARYYFIYKGNNTENPYLSAISWFLMANALVVGVLVFFFVDHAIRYFEIEVISKPYFLLAFFAALGLVWSKSYLRLLKVFQDTRKTPLFNLSRLFVQAAISLSLLFLLGLQERALILGYISASIIMGAFGFWGYVKRYPPRFRKNEFIELGKFILPLVPNRFSAFAVIPIQNFIVAGLGSTSLLGIYSVASVFGSAFTLILQNISDAIQPWLFRNFDTDDSVDDKIREATYTVALSIFYFVLIGAGVALLVVPLIVGDEFEEVAAYIPILMLFSFANFYKNIALSILMYFKGGVNKIAIGTYAHIGMILIFTSISIKPFGIWGVAWSLCLSRYLSSEITVYFVKKTIGYKNLVSWMKLRMLFYLSMITIALGSKFLIEKPYIYAILCFGVAALVGAVEASRLKITVTFLWKNTFSRKGD